MNEAVKAVIGILTGLTGITILAVILSKNSNTTGVIQSITSGFASDLSVAVSPINTAGSGGSNFGSFTDPLNFGSSLPSLSIPKLSL